jgi:hypothetical protein
MKLITYDPREAQIAKRLFWRVPSILSNFPPDPTSILSNGFVPPSPASSLPCRLVASAFSKQHNHG